MGALKNVEVVDDREAYIGEIAMFAGNFPPRGWAFCDGQILPIAPNEALFSLLGTTYGGDGRTTFGLPDLRGRIPLHVGDNSGGKHGPGLSAYKLGQKDGSESITPRMVKVTGSGDVSVIGEIPAGTNRQPYLGINYIICEVGIFPSRS